MLKFGFADKIPDPKRPGLDYYSDCIKFNWVDALVEKHKKHIKLSDGEDVYAVEYTPEELEIMANLKLKEKSVATYLIAIGLAYSMTVVSLV